MARQGIKPFDELRAKRQHSAGLFNIPGTEPAGKSALFKKSYTISIVPIGTIR
jgi:hypothetical protein